MPGQAFECGAMVKQIQIVVIAEFESWAAWLRVRRANLLATLLYLWEFYSHIKSDIKKERSKISGRLNRMLVVICPLGLVRLT